MTPRTNCVCPDPASGGMTSVRVSWCPVHGAALVKEFATEKRRKGLRVIEGGKEGDADE